MRMLSAPLFAVALAACGAPPRSVRITVGTAAPVAETNERFLSVAVDTAQALGGKFWITDGRSVVGDGVSPPLDFTRPQLRRLARELAPAYLRIGGTAADETYYDFAAEPLARAPAPYALVLNRGLWAGIADFARAEGFQLFVTLNAGRGPRDAEGAWRPDQARALLTHARDRGDPVAVWELGNEPNGYAALLHLNIDADRYAADFALLRAARDELMPAAKLAGPASAFWPLEGELNPLLPGVLRAGGRHFDIVSWHYYPQQSRRCPLATMRAAPEAPLDAEFLDRVATHAQSVQAAAAAHAPQAQVWLGETGGAQCGGEPGVNDSFVGGFWWLDQLGQLAARRQPVVVRQSLTGASYGLLDELTLEPRPDYWVSVLWKRLMGTRVLAAQSGDASVRVYAHCGRDGGVVLAALNLGTTEVALDAGLDADEGRAFVLSAAALDARDIALGGRPLALQADGALPSLEGEEASALVLPARTYGFFALPEAAVAACR